MADATATSADTRHSDVALECGWGRLVFGQTFEDETAALDVLRAERSGRRDIALYLDYPQVLVGYAPDELFIDPSITYRLDLESGDDAAGTLRGVRIRPLKTRQEAEELNRIYAVNGMVDADVDVIAANAQTPTFIYLLAESEEGEVLGTVTGVDHVEAVGDPHGGTSLWCLAVDPQARVPGVGRALVQALARHFRDRGRAFMDLSVLHDNVGAIALYEQLGFRRVPVLAVKRKNPINEPLFTTDLPADGLNPYARIIADEATRRGIHVNVIDARWGELDLSYAGRRIVVRESLSELTTAIAMSRCDDKQVTRRIMNAAGLRTPRGVEAVGDKEDRAFLKEVGEVVVKPARGEQGAGITVGVVDPGHLREAVDIARVHCPTVLLEEFVEGDDLRVIVIDHEVVAAAIRRPAAVIGTGRHTVAELIDKQSRRRAAATAGESRIPVDDHTRDTIAAAGYDLDSVLPEGETMRVRRTANLHTGGTIHDVTADLHPALAEVSVTASRALSIPVVGLDLLVPAVDGSDYVVVEANERPGLANHEPQPTAERFVDLLFPRTSRRARDSRNLRV
ncbi:MAG: N-acetylglutaminylglutamine synthetase [Nitriliruptorales bacterium]|nr:N-acetylglutaminylglutamine synthetase [Nitriliruptorales bacterium]